MAKLTEKQKKFVDEYLKDLNATQAVIRAGYSKNRASEIGYQLLQKTTVCEALQNRQKRLEQKTEITQERVLRELANVAFANATDFVHVDNIEYTGLDGKQHTTPVVEITPTKDVPPDKLAAIAAIKQGKEGIEIKTRDKIRALELLGKHLGIFGEAPDKTPDTSYFEACLSGAPKLGDKHD